MALNLNGLLFVRFDAGEAENWENDGYACVGQQGRISNTEFLQANTNRSEGAESNKIRLTATGFEWLSGGSDFNAANGVYLYMAFRRSDGYVQKPVEDATKVFAMDTGNASSVIPAFDSGFPVDFQLNTKPNSTHDKYAGSRLTQGKYQATNSTNGEDTSSEFFYDCNVGWSKGTGNDSSYQSWMWKRGAGFDVVNYSGLGGNRTHNHNLGIIPEMIWVKCRADTGKDWWVYHKGLNGGTKPQKIIILN